MTDDPYSDKDSAQRFMQAVYQPATSYAVPAIELDESTTKGAVATVFEKVNADDFDGFFAARVEAIVSLIEAATKKPVQRDRADSGEDPGTFDPDDPGVVPDDED